MKNIKCCLALLVYLLSSNIVELRSQNISTRLEPAVPLRNPDRGFHLESNYFVHNYLNPFNRSETYPEGFVDERLKRFGAEKDSITLTQLYLYLSDYVDRDIPQEAFERMQVIFDNLEANGFKAILRFAYNYTGLNTSGGETEAIISRHLEQLRPFLRKNLGLIATCQMGFIGAWGEWHNSPLSKNQEAKNKLVNTLLDIFPKEYCLQMRYPRQKELLTLDHPDDWKRIGFSNDYFTAGEHSHAPENDFVPGDENFEMVLKDASGFFMSGEIPYAENTEWGLHDLISVDLSLQILRDHHYSAFDITQNNELNIRHWKSYELYPEKLDSIGILYDMEYFRSKSGGVVSRSAYDFIRDHLGYRLNLVSSSFEKHDDSLFYSILLKNTGFATVVNQHPVYLAFINEKGEVTLKIRLSNVNSKDWQPYRIVSGKYETIIHTMEGKLPVSLPKGTYKVAIWMPDAQSTLADHLVYDIKWVENNSLQYVYKENSVLNVVGLLKW